MQDVLNAISTPVFWVTTVVFGLVINLVSAYIKSPIDKLFGSISKAWRTRSKEANQKFLNEAWNLAIKPEDMRLQFEHEVRDRLRILLGFLIVLLLSLLWYALPKDNRITGPISSVVAGLVITFVFFLLVMHVKTVRVSQVLEQAYQMRPLAVEELAKAAEHQEHE